LAGGRGGGPFRRRFVLIGLGLIIRPNPVPDKLGRLTDPSPDLPGQRISDDLDRSPAGELEALLLIEPSDCGGIISRNFNMLGCSISDETFIIYREMDRAMTRYEG